MIATLSEQEDVLKRIAQKIDRTEESVLRRALALYEMVVDDLRARPEHTLALLRRDYVHTYANKEYTNLY